MFWGENPRKICVRKTLLHVDRHSRVDWNKFGEFTGMAQTVYLDSIFEDSLLPALIVDVALDDCYYIVCQRCLYVLFVQIQKWIICFEFAESFITVIADDDNFVI